LDQSPSDHGAEAVEVDVAATERGDDRLVVLVLERLREDGRERDRAGPSTSVFERSKRSVSAKAISRSSTVTTSSTYSDITSSVCSPIDRVAIPSAMVSTLSIRRPRLVSATRPRRRPFGLHADDTHVGELLFDRDRDARDEPAAADRDDDRVEVGAVVDDL